MKKILLFLSKQLKKINIFIIKMGNILNYLFNLFFEIKYIFFLYKIKNTDININSVYLINKITNDYEILEVNNIIKKNRNNYIINIEIQNRENYILDIGYKFKDKDYRLNILLKDKPNNIIFPSYSTNELKNKINNQITFTDNNELTKLLNIYNGPFGDFYESKGFGITLYNLYSIKNKKFLFRDIRIIIEDLFLNEYEINEETVQKVLILNKNLDDNKIKKHDKNEEFILQKYKNFNLDWKNSIIGLFYYIIGKKKVL